MQGLRKCCLYDYPAVQPEVIGTRESHKDMIVGHKGVNGLVWLGYISCLLLGSISWADDGSGSVEPVEVVSPEPEKEQSAPESGGEGIAKAPPSVRYHSAESCVRQDPQTGLTGWIDSAHCVFSWRANASARWVDDWFGEQGDDASAYVVLQTGVGWSEAEQTYTVRKLSAHFDLPSARKRWRLVLTNEQEDSGGELIPGGDPLNSGAGTSSAALRWLAYMKDALRMDLDLGVRSGPEAFVRARVSDSVAFRQYYLLRGRQVFRYGSEERGYSSTSVDLERILGPNSVLLFANSAQWKEAELERGFVWGESLSLLHQMEREQSLGYGLRVYGVTRPQRMTDGWGPYLMYRRGVWRDWLHMEVEPAYTKRRDQQGEWIGSIEFRIEAQFGK